jgi:hypothetical protein
VGTGKRRFVVCLLLEAHYLATSHRMNTIGMNIPVVAASSLKLYALVGPIQNL